MIYPVVVFSIRIDGEIWIDVMVVTQQCELGAWVIALVSKFNVGVDEMVQIMLFEAILNKNNNNSNNKFVVCNAISSTVCASIFHL